MKYLRVLLNIAIVLALFVVMLGAYTRLTNAGLGCPDWPGCYGQLNVSALASKHPIAQASFPNQPIEYQKAWTEMIHRYAAGSLVLVITSILGLTLYLRRKGEPVSVAFPIFLCAWVVCQAALGMWTVTWRLLPIVVMMHLMFGAVLFSSLCVFRLSLESYHAPLFTRSVYWVAVSILVCQMLLGGWVSANYAGVACAGFPKCNGAWFPLNGLKEGLYLFSPIGVNYQGGVLLNSTRAALQVLHRLGAVVTALYLLGLATGMLLYEKTSLWRKFGGVLLLLLGLQVMLGLINVIYYLPLPVAVMHNGVAVMMLAVCIVMAWFSSRASHA